MYDLGWLDVLWIVGSMVAVIWAGTRAGDGPSTMDFLLAGRRLTLPMFVVTLVATWYGLVLGSGEMIYRHGLVMILCFGLPYYIAALAYAAWLSARIRQGKASTIPEQIGRMLGAPAGVATSMILVVLASPAPYVAMLGTMLSAYTGWSMIVSSTAVTALSLAVVFRGGLSSDVRANTIQFVIMYAGFAVLVAASWFVYGSPVVLSSKLEPEFLSIPGSIGWQGVAIWWVIALQTFIDPTFHMRVAAASTPGIAKRGLIWSVAFWALFDLLQLAAGLYARAFVDVQRPLESYLALADSVLPDGLRGLFLAGVIAAGMSTLSGYALVSGTVIGHDLYDSTRGRAPRRSSLRWGLMASGVFGVVVAVWIPSAIDIVVAAASIAVPAFLFPLVISYVRPVRAGSALGLAVILVPVLASVLWMVGQRLTQAPFMISIHAMLIGLLASGVLCCLLFRRIVDEP